MPSMFAYESGSPKTLGESSGVNVEISSRDVKLWRKGDGRVIREVERFALANGLKMKKSQYFIKGAGDLFLDHGMIEELKRKYPDVTTDGGTI